MCTDVFCKVGQACDKHCPALHHCVETLGKILCHVYNYDSTVKREKTTVFAVDLPFASFFLRKLSFVSVHYYWNVHC